MFLPNFVQIEQENDYSIIYNIPMLANLRVNLMHRRQLADRVDRGLAVFSLYFNAYHPGDLAVFFPVYSSLNSIT